MSFPNINTISPNKKITPIICAFSKTFCGTGLPVMIAEDPLTCVARGSGKALEMIGKLNSVFVINP